MAYEIIYKKRFLNKLLTLLDYLKNEWGQSVSEKFIIQLQKRLNTLSKHPFIGSPSNAVKSVRSILVTRQNRIFYKIEGNVIEAINMQDSRSDPNKNPYN
jgi:plasmid stabilization system protein ParE